MQNPTLFRPFGPVTDIGIQVVSRADKYQVCWCLPISSFKLHPFGEKQAEKDSTQRVNLDGFLPIIPVRDSNFKADVNGSPYQPSGLISNRGLILPAFRIITSRPPRPAWLFFSSFTNAVHDA